MTVVIRITLTNGANLRVAGMQAFTDGFLLTNREGDPITFVYNDEIASIGTESY